MTTFPLMTAILLMPLIGMLVLCFLPKEQEKAIKNIAIRAYRMGASSMFGSDQAMQGVFRAWPWMRRSPPWAARQSGPRWPR